MDAATAKRQAADALRIGVGLYDAKETVARLAEELKRVHLDRAMLEDVLAAQQRLDHAVRHCEHVRQRMARIAAAENAHP